MANKADDPAVQPVEDKDAQIEDLRKQLAEAQAAGQQGTDGAEPVRAVTAPVIIAQPMTADEKSEADRLAEQRKLEAIANDWLEEPVTIQLFKDGKDYKDDLFISVNNKRWQIKRGLPVTVPRKVMLLIADSEIQSIKAAEYSDQKQNEYQKAVDANML